MFGSPQHHVTRPAAAILVRIKNSLDHGIIGAEL